MKEVAMKKQRKKTFSLELLKEPDVVFNSLINQQITSHKCLSSDNHLNSLSLQKIIKIILCNESSSVVIPQLASQLQTLIHNITDGILILNPQGQVVYQNHNQKKFWEWVIIDSSDYIMRDPKENVINRNQWPFERLLRGEEFKNIELTTEDKTGVIYFTGIYKSIAVKDNRNIPSFFLLVVRDITEYRRALKEQQDLVKKLSAVFNNIDEGLIICDSTGKILEMNRKSMEMHGFSASANPDQRDFFLPEFEFIIPDSGNLDQDRYPMSRILHQEKFSDYELLVRNKQTGQRWIGSFNGTPIYDVHGNFILGVLTIRDVTSRNAMIKKLKQTDDMLRMAFDVGKIFAFEWDIMNNKVTRSSEGNEFLGLKRPSDWESADSFLNHIHPDDYPYCLRKIHELNPLDYLYTQTYRYNKPHTKEFLWLEERGQGFFDEKGNLTKIVGVAMDITHQKLKDERIKRKERLVHEQLAELQEIYNSAQIGLCLLDTELNYMRINKYLADLNGRSIDAHIGKNIVDVLPGSSERARSIANEVISTGKPVLNVKLSEKTKAFPDEKRHWIEHWHPFKDANGNIVGINVVVEDITEQKILNEKLEKHSVILDRMSEGVSMTDIGGFIQYTNPAFDVMFGYDQGELIGKHITILNSYSPKRNMEIIETMMSALKFNGRWEGDLKNKRKDGSEFITRARVSGLTINNDQFFISVQEDITQIKKLQYLLETSKKDLEIQVKKQTEELRQANEILEKILSVSTVMIAYLDPDFNFIRVNKAYAAMIEKESDFFIGKNHFDLFPNDENREVFERVLNTDSIFTAYSRPFSYRDRPDLGITYWDITVQPVKNQDDKIEALILILINVTDRKKAELELYDAQRKLNDAKRLSDIGVLASTVAHELRNPLAAINMALANIKRKVGNSNIYESQIKTIEKKTAESDQIINNLLFYSRIKHPHREIFDIMAILYECLELVQRQQQKHVNINIHRISADPVLINADPVQMREVFCNILNNAHDAVPGFSGMIDINIQKENSFLKIVIGDNGSGIDPNHLSKVTEPFFTTKAKGTGLGLSVSVQIINLHHGDLIIESKPGQGTTVTIKIPLNV